MLFLEFNLAKTTSVQPARGRDQAQQKPNSVKAPIVEAECKENPVQWKWQEAQHARNRDSKNKLSRKLTRLNLRFQKTSVKVGDPHSYGWKDIWLTKFELLYNLAFLICSNPLQTGEWQWVKLRDSGRGYSPMCPKGSTICCVLVAVAKLVRVILSLIFFVPRIRPMKTVSIGQILSRFFWQVMKVIKYNLHIIWI